MEKIEFTKLEEIINDAGFAIVSGVVDGYQIDEVTKEFLHTTSTTLIPGFGLPNNFVLEHPPEDKEGTILVYSESGWMHNKELYLSRRIAKLTADRDALITELNTRLTRLERRKAVNRASAEELAQLKEWTNLLFDIEELDLTDPSVELPKLP